jgi:chemotaxis signal transduction protein
MVVLGVLVVVEVVLLDMEAMAGQVGLDIMAVLAVLEYNQVSPAPLNIGQVVVVVAVHTATAYPTAAKVAAAVAELRF